MRQNFLLMGALLEAVDIANEVVALTSPSPEADRRAGFDSGTPAGWEENSPWCWKADYE